MVAAIAQLRAARSSCLREHFSIATGFAVSWALADANIPEIGLPPVPAALPASGLFTGMDLSTA